MELMLTILGLMVFVKVVKNYFWWNKQLDSYILPDLIDLEELDIVRPVVKRNHPKLYVSKRGNLVKYATYRKETQKEFKNRQQ